MSKTIQNHKQRGLVILLGVGLLSLIMLVSSLTDLPLETPSQPPIRLFLQSLESSETGGFFLFGLPINLIPLLIGCMWSLFFIALFMMIRSPDYRQDMMRRLLIYTLWLMFIYWGMTTLQPTLNRLALRPQSPTIPEIAPTAIPADMTIPVPPNVIVTPPTWLVTAFSVGLISLVLFVGWWLWQRRPRETTDMPTDMLDQFSTEAQRAIIDLQTGQNLQDTVIRCYGDMRQLLAQQQRIERKEAMTPREFEQGLAEIGVDLADIRRLTHLFEEVRYGDYTADAAMQKKAQRCLQTIVDRYGRST